MFEGSIPALITPFKKGKLDFDALSKLINWHIEQGSNGLVISGTTGESPTLDHKEHCKIIAEATKVSTGRIPIIAGVGSNCTAEALTLSRAAEDAGVDGMLHVTGYYNKPSQLQVIEHFRTIDKHTTLPILIYNIPARTGQELTVETIAVLADLKMLSA